MNKNLLILTLSMIAILCTVDITIAGEISEKDHHMKIHHLHMMMNNGILLATEGSTLMMLSRMQMSPGTDEMTATHGREMMSNSKELIDRTMIAIVKELHSRKVLADSLLHYSEIIDTSDILKQMDMKDILSPDLMKMSHLHSLLNHALEMAAEGSNLAILGHMRKSGEAMDTYSIEQGNQMMQNAKLLLSAVMKGRAMQDLNENGITPEKNNTMKQIHAFADSAGKVIDLLIKMPNMNDALK
jgi:hypothetical protein